MKRQRTIETRGALLQGHLDDEGGLALTPWHTRPLIAGGLWYDNLWSKWEDERYTEKQASPAQVVFEWMAGDLWGSDSCLGLALLGPPRSGKSHLAKLAGIYGTVVHGWQHPLYVNWPGFIASQHASYSADDGGQAAALYELMRTQADFLILDDVSAEKSSHATLSMLYNVIESCAVKRRPFIITTNIRIGRWLGGIVSHGTARRENGIEIETIARRIAGRLSCKDTGLLRGILKMEVVS